MKREGFNESQKNSLTLVTWSIREQACTLRDSNTSKTYNFGGCKELH